MKPYLHLVGVLLMSLTMLGSASAVAQEIVHPEMIVPQTVNPQMINPRWSISIPRISIQPLNLQPISLQSISLQPLNLTPINLQRVQLTQITPTIVGSAVNLWRLRGIRFDDLRVATLDFQPAVKSYAELSARELAQFGVKGEIQSSLEAELFPQQQRMAQVVFQVIPAFVYSAGDQSPTRD